MLGAVLRWLLVAALATALVTGCTTRQDDPTPRADDDVVVASFDFAESELLAEIYAQALEQAGVPVQRQLRLGPRELVLPALRQGLVDVVPEYLGSALAALSPQTPAPSGATAGTEAAHRELGAALGREDLRALRPSAAQNQNGLAVTRATAERLRLRTTSDLRPAAAELTLTGPAECPSRPYCLPGLSSVYGLTFGSFVPYESDAQRITALEQGVVDVALVFTTDGLLAAGDLVLLADDRALQPVENVVPVVTERAVSAHGERLVKTLDAVSAELDSAALAFLNWRVDVAGGTVADEARGWLLRQQLLPR